MNYFQRLFCRFGMLANTVDLLYPMRFQTESTLFFLQPHTAFDMVGKRELVKQSHAADMVGVCQHLHVFTQRFGVTRNIDNVVELLNQL